MKIAVAVSGGMDSLYALHSLHTAGHECIALHGRFLSAAAGPDPIAGLTEFCARLGVPFHCVDRVAEFERHVIIPFCREYAAGQTPNPCAVCNAAIKFGSLFEAALALGAERLATGHYARLLPHPDHQGEWLPVAGMDTAKDQSYFLVLTPIERLRSAMFPLGGKRKSAIARELRAMGIIAPLQTESQEICFVPGNNYRAFLTERVAELPGPGPVLDEDGNRLGAHQGLWRHTEGQRRGLGIAAARPLHVLRKDAALNALIVGPAERAVSTGCRAEQANYLLPPAQWPKNVFVRVRYRQKPHPARVECGLTGFTARFATPQPVTARGQVAAVYDAYGFLLAGGIIAEVDAA